MNRFLRCLLLSLAFVTLPVQSVVAAVMPLCAAPMAGMSMTDRHALIKVEADAALQKSGHDHCPESGMHATPADAAGGAHHVDHDHGQSGKTDQHAAHTSHGACGTCGACALGALSPALPQMVMANAGHAMPLADNPCVVSFLVIPADRPPAGRA